MNKKLILLTSAAILSFGAISESRAITCPTGTQGSDSTSHKDYCGTNCCWGIDDNHVLTITPAIDPITNKPFENVTMKNFDWTTPGEDGDYTDKLKSTAPWARMNATSVVVEDGIVNIGQGAFIGDTKITNIDMPSVKSIGLNAFFNASSLNSVNMPEITSVGQGAFLRTALTSVDMPKIISLGSTAFYNVSSLASVGLNESWKIDSEGYFLDSDNNRVRLQIPDGYYGQIYTNECHYMGGIISDNDGKCYAGLGNNVFKNTLISTCGQQGGSCGIGSDTGTNSGTSTGGDISGDFNPADCYNNGQVPYGGKCVNEYPFARKRWTPAEAAEWLRDGNDNFVVLTFKK